MKSNRVLWLALGLALCSIALNIKQYYSFNERVTRIVESRERIYSNQLAVNLNKSRELMGQSPVSPTNYAEVLSGYIEGAVSVMNGMLTSTNTTPDKK